MKKLLVVVLVLVMAVGALGYWRGWFSVTREGKLDVQVDPAKFKQDREAFGTKVGEKAKAMKEQVASLWTKSEQLSGEDKVHAQRELGELKEKRDRLEKQIKELEDAGQDRFESIKQDLSRSLAEVETKLQEWTTKLEKSKEE